MTHENQNIWRIMKSFSFEFDKETQKDLLCLICNNLLINAYCGPCGCRYCFECILKHLDGEERFCPGDNRDCKLQILGLYNNISIDQLINERISKLTVKCPETDCLFRDELQNIESHLQVCPMRSVRCPYWEIGCKEINIVGDSLKNHMFSDLISHSKLISETINNLRNESEVFNQEMRMLKNENKDMKDEMKLLKIEIENNETKLSEFHDQYITELQQIIAEMKQENIGLKETLAKFGNIEARLKDLQTNQEHQNYGDYLWRIENFTDKLKQAKAGINECIFSDAFYSHKNGYKMCLKIYPNGFGDGKSTHLTVGLCLMKGSFDDILQWPFKHKLCIDLINHITGIVHTTEEIEYADFPDDEGWNKPQDERNSGIGFHEFIKLQEILSNQGLINNDTIFIRCKIYVT